MLNKNALLKQLELLRLHGNEILLVHSAFKSLGPIEGGPQTVIDALIEAVGPSGTVVFPTFNFQSWTESHYFDITHTASAMGALTEFARADPRFQRTRHPIYSFVAAGPLQHEMTAIDTDNCYGEGSVFDYFYQKNALMLSLGLDFNSTFSITHHAEKISGACTYRYDKPFSGIYVDESGTPALKTYSMMVRDFSKGVLTLINPAVEKLMAEGIVLEGRLGQARCHTTHARPYTDGIVEICRSQPELLHQKTR